MFTVRNWLWARVTLRTSSVLANARASTRAYDPQRVVDHRITDNKAPRRN